MTITATNKATGEIVELAVDTPEQIVEAWRVAGEYAKTANALRDHLKKMVPFLVGEKGTSEPIGNFMFRVSNVQRMNYDKSVMRNVFDEDTLDLFLEPNKTAVDKYLKEHLSELGTKSTELRQSMVPVGIPYQVIKLEKLTEDDS